MHYNMMARKQYELTNHLGNVLATVSDRKTPVIVGTAVTRYNADVVSAQYYYPFGSTMPEHTFLAQQNLILNDNFSSLTGWNANLGSGYTMTLSSGRLKFTSSFEYSGPYKAFATIPGKRYRIKFTLDRDNTPAVAFVARDDQWNNIKVDIAYNSGTFELIFIATTYETRFHTEGTDYGVGGSKTFYLDDVVIEEVLEGYRYAFNSQEKDDEIAGQGNINAAEYWEYDTRLGRRWNTDIVGKEYESPYATFANNPVWFVDPMGSDTFTFTTSSTTVNFRQGLNEVSIPPLTTTTRSLNVTKSNGPDVFLWNINNTSIDENGNSMSNSSSTQFYPNSTRSSDLTNTSSPFTLFSVIGLSVKDKDEVFLGKLMYNNPELSEVLINHNAAYRKHAAIGETYGMYASLKFTIEVATFAVSAYSALSNGNVFGLRNGNGPFGKNGLKIGNYRLDVMYSNPSVEKAGTIFSLKQMKANGATWRWDYGKLHSTGEFGLHSTIRFHFNGTKYGSTAQRKWYPTSFKAPFFKAF